MSESLDSVLAYGPWLTYQENGWWQPLEGPVPRLRKLVMERAANDPAKMAQVSINSYQEWVECDWIYPHGSPEMRQHLVDKTHEESCDEVIEEFIKMGREGIIRPSGRTNPKLLDELADVDFTVTAQASQNKQSLSKNIAYRLHMQGVLVPQPHDLTIGQIDALIDDGFKPWILVRQNIGDIPEVHDELDELLPHACWNIISFALQGVSEKLEDNPSNPVAQEQLQRASADAVLYSAYSARRWGGGSLAESICLNFRKLGRRVETGTLDKAQGPRLHETSVQ